MGVVGKERRIVFVIGSLRRGGAERVISILANRYASAGWSVDVLLLLDQQCSYVLNPKISVIPICNGRVSRLGHVPFWLRAMRKHFRDRKPRAVVSFIARINVLTLLACMGLGLNVVVSERTDPKHDGRSWLVRMATSLLYRTAKTVVFQTKSAQSCFPRSVQRKSVIIWNPISVDTVAQRDRRKKIVTAGRLQPEKNHEMLINAFCIVRNRYPDYELVIYGEGRLRRDLLTQIARMNLTDSVFLPGSVADVHEQMADAEMFVLSSNHEGLSNALCEAMLMGLPCISTKCGGSNEVLIHDQNGLLVDIGNEQQLAEAMLSLIEDKEKAIRLSFAGNQTAEQMRKDIVASHWETVIECG
jgi:GalNAc-alpha-(1->4)-GalNAc-alpha-(1->3)-diNAcBac-PP-undecaprenol alpha-1,4-N-acetyl-D-galactosaminyltransferase